jgi:DNA invertase Pin-like site-specific DNA recombinase
MVAAYLRVSSTSQDDAMQLDAIERCARARGDLAFVIFREKRSGKTLARPVLEELRDRVRRGEIGRVYVYRLDRLARSGIRDTLGVLQELRSRGCDVVSVSEGWLSLDGPAAELVIAALAWAAEMERQANAERLADARIRLEKRGGKWGRPRRMGPADRERARHLRAQGTSYRQIAVALKVPFATIRRALMRDAGDAATPPTEARSSSSRSPRGGQRRPSPGAARESRRPPS